jgi:hypothetical protein
MMDKIHHTPIRKIGKLMKNTNHSSRMWIFLLLATPWFMGCLLFSSQTSGGQEPERGTDSPTKPTISPTLPPLPSPMPSPTPIAEVTPTPTPEPVWTFYRNEEMHPADDDANLAFDQEGYLWVTGYGGVIRWDLTAKTFVAYTQADGLSAARIRGLIIDSHNVPWIATDEEIQKFNGESWETFTIPTSARTKGFAEGANGKFWLCSGSVYSFEAGSWQKHGTHNGLNSNICYQMKIGPDGNPWVIAQDNSLSHFNQGWNNYEVPEVLRRENEIIFSGLARIHVAPDGVVWAQKPFGAVRFDGETWINYTLPEKEGLVTAFGLSSSGTPWLAQTYLSKTYFRAYNGNDWPVIMNASFKDGMPTKNWINSAIAAPDGAVWFIGQDNFIRTMQHGWTVYPRAREYYAKDFLVTVTFSPDGKLYYAGSQGILELGESPDDLQIYSSVGQLADNSIRDIQFDAQGMMWVWQGKDSDFGVLGSLQRFDGRRFETFTDLEMIWYLVARDGSLWVRVRGQFGLEWWDGNDWNGFGKSFSDLRDAGLSWMRGVNHIAQDDQGQIWVSFEYDGLHGVAVFNGERWQTWPLPETPPRISGSHELKFAPDETLWLASDRFGASYLLNGTWRSVKIPDSLLKNTVDKGNHHNLYPLQFNSLNQPILLYFDRSEEHDPALYEMSDYSWSRVPIDGSVQTILYHNHIFWAGTSDNGLYYRQDKVTSQGSEWMHLSGGDWQGCVLKSKNQPPN